MAERMYDPMLAQPLRQVPENIDDYNGEPKLDGWRELIYFSPQRSRAQTRLILRGGGDFTDTFPDVAEQIPDALGGHAGVLDGEQIAIDAQGRHSHNTVRKFGATPIFMAFDILELDGKSLINQPWEVRRRMLEDYLRPQENIQLCPSFENIADLLDIAQQLSLEGIMLKRKKSLYFPGRRTREWLKFKFPTQQR